MFTPSKSNQITLFDCLIDAHRKKRHDEFYELFCEAVGNDDVSFTKFKFSVKQILEGNFDKVSLSIIEMLKNNEDALIPFIPCLSLGNLKDQEKFLDPIFKKYQNLCELIGDDVISYRAFNHLYFGQFKKGKGMEDMPVDVMDEVMKYLNVFERCPLRKVSHSLRDLVNDSDLTIDSLRVNIASNTVSLKFDKKSIVYSSSYCMQNCQILFGYSSKMVQNANYERLALNDLRVLLENPKLKIKTFRILSSYGYSSIIQMFESLKSRIHVECFEAKENELALGILPCLKPAVLQTISIEGGCFFEDDIDKLVKTEQWKLAKHFMGFPYGLFEAPLENLFHLTTFIICREEIHAKDIHKIRDILFKSPHFESCSIHGDLHVKNRRHEFGPALPENPNIHHYRIHGSKHFFEIEFDIFCVRISRKC